MYPQSSWLMLYPTPQSLQKEVDAFFAYCEKKPKIPLLEGLAVYLKTSYQTLSNYSKREGYAEIMAEARLKIAENLVTRGLEGEFSSAITQLVLKNHHGYKDKQEIDHTSNGETLGAAGSRLTDINKLIQKQREEIQAPIILLENEDTTLQ